MVVGRRLAGRRLRAAARSHPACPGALVLVVGGLLASWLFDLGAHGVALVGDVPRGLPSFEVPDPQLLWDHAGTVAVAAVALVLIGFSQTAGDARAFAAKHRYQIDIDQESVAQAMANTGAGLFQGMPVSTSLSASSLNDHSGARTGLASITSGVTVLLTLLVLAPLFSDLPKPVLAALIIEAVVMGMMDVPEMRRLARVQRFDFWIAVAAIVGTLVFGVLAGVMIGIGLSLLWLISVATRPHMPLLGRRGRAPRCSGSSTSTPTTSRSPGSAVIRLDGGLFFATSDALEDRVREVVHVDTGPARGSCSTARASTSSTPRARPSSTRSSTSPTTPLSRSGWPGSSPQCSATLARDGVLDRIGADRIHGSVHRAVQAQLPNPPSPSADRA